MQRIDDRLDIPEHECTLHRSSGRRQGTGLGSFHLLVVLSAILLAGCACTRDIRVGTVSPNQDVPAGLFVDYAEQMRYLAMRSEPADRAKRLSRLDAIDLKSKEARIMMEEYRKEFGFRECGSSE